MRLGAKNTSSSFKSYLILQMSLRHKFDTILLFGIYIAFCISAKIKTSTSNASETVNKLNAGDRC